MIGGTSSNLNTNHRGAHAEEENVTKMTKEIEKLNKIKIKEVN